MLRFLKQPYPLITGIGYDLKISSFVSLFAFFVLFVFQPFGLSTTHANLRYYLIAGYSVTCFIVMLLNLLIIPKVLKNTFKEEYWTVYKRILWLLWIVFAVGVGNYLFACLFNVFFDFYRLGLNLFFYLLFITVLIAIIPIIVVTIVTQNYLLKQNLKVSEEISARLMKPETKPNDTPDENKKVELLSENEKEKYEFPAGGIFFISSEGNYVKVCYAEKKTESVLIRNSLKRIQKQLKDYPSLIRCHRAYIVNIKKVKKAEGNAQGLKLSLAGLDKTIPVARNYSKEFKKRLGIS